MSKFERKKKLLVAESEVYRQLLKLELQTFNVYLLAQCISSIIIFIFVVGAFQNDVGNFAKIAGFSIAMNWGVAKRPSRAANPVTNKLPKSLPQTA